VVPLVLSGIIVLFGLALLGLQALIILRAGKGWTDAATRTFGLTLVVISGVFLCTAGFSTEQITPMISLLGTVAGFLLGRSAQSGPQAPAEERTTQQRADEAPTPPR